MNILMAALTERPKLKLGHWFCMPSVANTYEDFGFNRYSKMLKE